MPSYSQDEKGHAMTTPQMPTAQQLLQRYKEGRITATGLILDVLSLPGKQRLTKILEALPLDILEQLKDFVEDYKPEREVFRGLHPKTETVRFVTEWFESADRTSQTSNRRHLGKGRTS